jgi:hypothetical protein
MRKINLTEMLKNYEQTLTTLGFTIRKDWAKELLHARRMIGNACKISYITKSKIEGLKTNVKGFKLNPECIEQREKHFTAERPSKFLGRIIDTQNGSDNERLSLQIAEVFNHQFLANIKTTFVMFSGNDIGKQYAKCKGLSGCMSGDKGSSSNWFDCYADTDGLRLCALVDDTGTILIRALLWYDKTSKKYFLEKSYEQHNISGDEQLRKTYQAELLQAVLKKIRRTKIDCAFNSCLHSYDIQEGVLTYPDANLTPAIHLNNIREYGFLPYSDTWKSLNRITGEWVIDEMEGNSDYYLCTSENGHDRNESRIRCYDCGGSYLEDDEGICYSDYHSEYYCGDCCNWVEDRDTYIRSEETTFYHYSDTYLLTEDLSL